MKWKRITDELPVVPIDRYGVKVLICAYDSVFEEISPGRGLSVSDAHYGTITDRNGKVLEMFEGADITKLHFQTLYYGQDKSGKNTDFWGPVPDKVTHWMYYPEPPQYKTEHDIDKDRLNFVYDDNDSKEI